MGETAESLTFGAMAIRKYLGDENPDDRALPNRVRGDEGEDADRNERKMIGKERPRDQAQRDDVAERADIEKSAAAQPVNQPEADKSENEISDADADGLQQRSLCPETGKFKDARRKIQNGVDAGQLIEERNQDSEHDRLAQTRSPEMSRLRLLRRCGHNRIRPSGNFGFWRPPGAFF